MISISSLGRLGRLGNQMFQYACAYAVAKRNRAKLSISTYDAYSERPVNQLVETFRLSSASHNDYTGVIHQFHEADFSYDARIENVPDGTDLVGYFQSEKYFCQYRSELLENEFVFNSDVLCRALDLRQGLSLDGETCSIHVRMGDYKNLSSTHTNLGKDYYASALAAIPECNRYLVFSDEPIEAKRMLDRLGIKRSDQFVYPDLDYAASMCAMSMCDHHIIANSSFSWWGAWLSSNSKTIIAPTQWFGPQGPQNWSDVYCSGWKKI
jgi:hypothetical protein